MQANENEQLGETNRIKVIRDISDNRHSFLISWRSVGKQTCIGRLVHKNSGVPIC